MNKTILFVPFILSMLTVASQEVEFHTTDWQNPAVFEKGQNAPHAFHIPYSTEYDALKNRIDRNENYRILNGTWKFRWVEVPDSVPEEFWNPKFETENWEDIKVPSNWQMEGFGYPKFRNIALTFESNPPNIPGYFNPVGCYKRKFIIPKSWKDKEIMLRFEGVKSASYVWVNGKRAGYNQGGFEPAEYNITPFVKTGENDLAVEVLRFSDGSYLENQDMWRLSGIFRDVKLYAQPKTFIYDYYVFTDLDEAYKNATLNLEVVIKNTGKDSAICRIETDVLDSGENSILEQGRQHQQLKAVPGEITKAVFSIGVKNPPKWSAEFPNLFTLLVHLKDEEGNTLEVFTKKIGFREVEYKNHILTVNGVPVKLNGVNSHMHHPDYGQAVPVETLKKDLLLMKQFNINCVRTSHYPPSPEYIELANELGVYIFAEVGDEAHANTRLSFDPAWTEMYKDRSRKLVYRDRNNPSVIVWSAGNESGSGNNIHEVIKTGKAIDPGRPAWMYGGNNFYIPFEDLVGPRYWLPVDYKNLAEGKVLPAGDQRASFMDEYLAATGNGLGGMDEYWELIRKYPRLTGGAIWDWISPGITTSRRILPDLSPRKNDGQIMGRPVFTKGKNGKGLAFSGHDDWVEFYRDPSLDITGKELSIGFWVKPFEIPQPNTFIAKGKYGYGILMEDPETLEFYIQGDKRYSVKYKVEAGFYGKWHHIAGTFGRSVMKLFVDEKQVGQTRFAGEISDTPFPLCIGRDADTHDQGEFSGRLSKMIIDDVRVFNREISVGEIKNDIEEAVLALDFEEEKNEGNFYAVGLGGRTYGIIWPDRTIQPEIWQIKKSGQPVAIEAVEVEKGILKFTNHHHFKNLKELEGVWVLAVEGDTIQRGFFELDLPPGKSAVDTIEFRKPQTLPGTECILTVSFLLKENTNWAEAGHEVAWEQFTIPAIIIPDEKKDFKTAINVSVTKTEVVITGHNFMYVLDKQSGELKSLQYNGAEYLESGPVFTVWRAPLANDADPWGSGQFQQRNFTPGFGRSIDNQLRTLGLRDLQAQVDEVQVQKKDGKIIVRMKVFSNSSLPANKRMNNYQGVSAFEQNNTWIFSADGTVRLEQEIIPHGPMPDMLQKTGLQLELPKNFNEVVWFGRGPFENYPDRKTGAKVGLYRSNADEMYVPYIFPQDYGNRCDVRWLKVGDGKGKGLWIKGGEMLNFSLHKFTTDNLERAVYTYQLHEAPNIILNVDYEVTGVGGTANRQLQKYRVMPTVKNYSLTIKPF